MEAGPEGVTGCILGPGSSPAWGLEGLLASSSACAPTGTLSLRVAISTGFKNCPGPVVFTHFESSRNVSWFPSRHV